MITESIIRKSIQGIITNRLKAELVVQKVTEGLLAPQQKKIYKHEMNISQLKKSQLKQDWKVIPYQVNCSR
jgi:hypothetical protein